MAVDAATLKFDWPLSGDDRQRLRQYHYYSELDPYYRKVIQRLHDCGVSYHEIPKAGLIALDISDERALELLGDLIDA